ncbi:processed acidic surface protein [Alkalicoccus daliensis]|uniref:Processed acidic surface protein n=1 Tax=Alkalicoccus daliensis TaxID=745820 RepID=A0A1H0HGR4_9BACI|nr:processed acidic surface protein [Alkalicoccus daliensis]SDO18307.1 processed acidic surface protein [Alkalicoccus daliensis]
MKKFIILLLVSAILFAGIPLSASAAPAGKDLTAYLEKISWIQPELEEHLDFYDLKLKDFEDVEDLRSFLGPVLSPNRFAVILEDYELTEEEALQLLRDNGELEEGQSVFDAYKFADDLDYDLYFYSLTPVTDEAMEELLKEFNLTYKELEALFAEYDDDLSYYEHMEDLYWMTELYLSGDYEMYEDFMDIDELFAAIGLTEEELDRLIEHFMELDIENDAFWEKLEELSYRMMAFEEFDYASEVTPEMIAELLDIFTELLDLFQMDASFYLIKGEEKKEINLAALVSMTTTDGYDLLIELYNKEGDFLADILLTGDMFGSELIQDTGKDLKEMEEVVETAVKEVTTVKAAPAAPAAVSKEAVVTTTERGGRLPDTATNSVNGLLAGLFVMMLGAVLYRRARVSANETR